MLDYVRKGPNGYGHRPTHPSRRPKSVFAHAGFSSIIASSAPVPAAVDNSGFCSDVMDQGQTGTCEAHTESGVTYASLAANGSALDFVPSPLEIYKIANGLQRAIYNPGIPTAELPLLEDDGLEPVFATNAVAKFGVVPSKAPASDGRNSDVEDGQHGTRSNAADEADPIAFVQGATKIVRGTSSLDVFPSARIDAVRRLLAARKFVKLAIYADSPEFQSYDGTNPLSAPVPNPGSDHAVFLHSYRTDARGKVIFVFRNSWGPNWGLSGNFEGDESFLLACTDLEVVDAVLDSPIGGG